MQNIANKHAINKFCDKNSYLYNLFVSHFVKIIFNDFFAIIVRPLSLNKFFFFLLICKNCVKLRIFVRISKNTHSNHFDINMIKITNSIINIESLPLFLNFLKRVLISTHYSRYIQFLINRKIKQWTILPMSEGKLIFFKYYHKNGKKLVQINYCEMKKGASVESARIIGQIHFLASFFWRLLSFRQMNLHPIGHSFK